jgi:hypothetical protein
MEGDVVTVAVQVQSSSSSNSVAKISYKRRGPFIVVKALRNGSYVLRKLSCDADSPTVTRHGSALNLLPPALWQCEPVDAADLRFMNINVAETPL